VRIAATERVTGSGAYLAFVKKQSRAVRFAATFRRWATFFK
jgi:hypothetical protein